MADHEDGSLDLVVMTGPAGTCLRGQALAHWLAAGLPLIMPPSARPLLNLDIPATSAVALTLLAGTRR